MSWVRRCALLAVLPVLSGVAGTGLLAAPVAAAEGPAPRLPGVQVPLLAGSLARTSSQPSPSRAMLVAASPASLNAPAVSTWQVTYDAGFNANTSAKAAFQAAVDTWAGIVRSTVPIKVEAHFTPLGSNVLGSAGPNGLFPLDFESGTAYFPAALADALSGADQAENEPDIIANFSSNQAAFYFGTDGNPAFEQYDFESVVMHELGHGLGFLGSARFDSDTGEGSFDVDAGGTVFDPFVFDNQVSDAADTDLLTLANPSVAIGTALTSGQVYWNGSNGTSANGGTKPKLYAPSAWEGGSSISHLDETAFPMGNPNSLMTPVIYNSEAIHSPGVVTVGIFNDMGWQATLGPPSVPTGVSAAAGTTSATVSWTAPAANGSAITGYTVLVHDGATVTEVASAGSGTSKLVAGLTEAKSYTFGVKATNALGTSAESTLSPTVVTGPDETPPTVSISSPVTLSKSSGTVLFSGSDPGQAAPTYTCTLDAVSVGCSPFSFTGLADGSSHTATVTATDAATNHTTATRTWTVDSTAPAVTLTGKPALVTNATSATLGATVTDAHPGSTVCKLDTVVKTCGGALSSLTQALHTFTATATDAVGNATTSSYTWRVDTSKPTVTTTALPIYTLSTSVVFSYAGADTGGAGIASYSVRSRNAPYSGTFGALGTPVSTTAASRSFTVSKGYTYCFSVQSRDKAGNLSAWSAERCTAIALDDASLAASSGWTRGSSSAYYAGTYSTALKSAVTLTRTSVQARRLYLVATVCKGCGSVTVSFNGTVLRTVSLSTTSTTPSYKKLFLIKDFGAVASGTLVVKTTSAARVYVDGVVLSRV